MGTRQNTEFSILMPEALLGPLNDVEQKHAPEKLYVKGPMKIPLPGPRASIVGSRKASSAGLDATIAITKTLVRKKVVIVSGLAQGIDTAAHTTSIQEGGRTIAVLGTPLDRSYPPQNTRLQQKIMREYLAISQFASGQPILRKNFVIRNRTMALISNATIIVEAKDDSGSLHQGWEALRLGRPLFIWKAILNDSSLKIPRKMLDYGAIELGTPEEILSFLPSSEPALEIAQ